MRKEYRFNNPGEFLNKLRELIKEGVNQREMEVFTPYPIHEVEEILQTPDSPLKFFTLTGAVTGFCTGFLFPSYTVVAWPLITSGKPFISIPPFLIIAFELTILFGAIFSLLGIIILGRLPNFCYIAPPKEKEYGNEFVIVIEKDGEK
ncbi:MAG: DUF3341 domain-containing protein [Planctomycetota bacterium]|nr:MAG: DUF3341 domain-containing protein [Planctomycetota bacterium]